MKALVGAWDHAPQKLLAEITALRTKVAQLRAENDDLRAENAVLVDRLRELEDAQQLASTSA